MMWLKAGLSSSLDQPSSSVLDLLQLICIPLPSNFNFLHLLSCVHTLGEIIPNSKLGRALQVPLEQGLFLMGSKLWTSQQCFWVLSFPPWGVWSILETKQKLNEWKRKTTNITDNLCTRMQQEDKKKINWTPQARSQLIVEPFCVICATVHMSHCRSTINHHWVRDYQFSACVSAQYFSAGLLSLRGSTSVFFFFFPFMFWTQAAVGSRLAQPPSHTEGLQYWSDVVRLLFVWPLSLYSPAWPPSAGPANTRGMLHFL